MRQIRRIVRLTLAVLMFIGSVAGALSAQEGGPLLKSDLVRMMTASNYTSTELAAIVRLNCVGFEPTVRDRNQLETLPGSELVLAEVDRCVSKPRTVVESTPAVVEAAPAEKRVVRTPPKPAAEITLVDLAVEQPGPVVPELKAPPTATTLRPAEIAAFARRETKPRLTNWDEVTTAFRYEYRPNVRTSGTVVLSVRVGSDGSVLEASIKQSTGDQAMSDAALRVTTVMKFAPAMMRDQAVESLTELPIHFNAN